MPDPVYEQTLLDQLRQLDEDQLRRLLNYARLLAKTPTKTLKTSKMPFPCVLMFRPNPSGITISAVSLEPLLRI